MFGMMREELEAIEAAVARDEKAAATYRLRALIRAIDLIQKSGTPEALASSAPIDEVANR